MVRPSGNDPLVVELTRRGYSVHPFSFGVHDPIVSSCEAMIGHFRLPQQLSSTPLKYLAEATANPFLITHFEVRREEVPQNIVAWRIDQDVEENWRSFLDMHFPPLVSSQTRSPRSKWAASLVGLLLVCIVLAVGLTWIHNDAERGRVSFGLDELPVVHHDPNEIRLALVIAQSAYRNGLNELTATRGEAELVAAALHKAGFNVDPHVDLDRARLSKVLEDFRNRVAAAGPRAVGFVYYTGHGAQMSRDSDSYLLGVDSQIDARADIAQYGVSLESQRDAFDLVNAKAIFLVFDACRDVPSRLASAGTKSAFKETKGLGRIIAPTGSMLVAYATEENNVAIEKNFAPILARYIEEPGLEAVAMFHRVQLTVSEMTNQQQRPRFIQTLDSQVCFSGCPDS